MGKFKLYRGVWKASKLILSLVLLALMSFSVAMAQSIEAIEYQYDAAGNLIGYKRAVSTGVPVIESLSPGFLNRESTSRVRLLGDNFAGAVVSLSQTGLTLVQTDTISNTEMQIFVSVSEDAPLGSAEINVSSALGADSAQILVAERVPIISTNPNPILLTTGADPETVTLLFDRPIASDQVYSVRLVDDGIASIPVTTLTLPAGETEVSLTVTGNTVGSTLLEITQALLAINIPVIIAEEFDLPAGDASLSSTPLGVLVSRFEPPIGDLSKTSLPLGVTVRSATEFIPVGPLALTARPLGVTVRSATANALFPEGPLALTARPLGVTVNGAFELPVGISGFQSDPVGANKPPYLEDRSAEEIGQGETITLVLSGVGLLQVSEIDFSPNTGISQPGGFQVNATGTEITVDLEVAPSTPLGERRIIVRTNSEQVPFLATELESIQIISN